MLIRKPADIRPSEITSKDFYLNRRQFMRNTALASPFAQGFPRLRAAPTVEATAAWSGTRSASIW